MPKSFGNHLKLPRIFKSSSSRSPSPVGDKSSLPNVAYSTFKISLALAASAAESFAPLKSAIGMLSVLLTNYDQTVDNKKQIEELVPKIKSMMDSLLITSNDKKNLPAHKYAERETSRRREFKRSFDKARQKLEELSHSNILVKFLSNADQRGEIVGVVEDIREAILNYQTSLQKDLYEMTSDIYTMNSDLYKMNREHVEFDYLRELPYAKTAGYRSGNREPCLKGTRIEILHEIEKWATDEDDHPVYWLCGKAGEGKTTLAQSFAERAFAEGHLGASFFCSRGVTDRSDINNIFPTLASDLADKFHQFGPIIAKVIKDNRKAGYESLSYQLENLLIIPLQRLVKDLKADPHEPKRLPMVLVIDALDECQDDKAESAILSVLATQLESMDSVKFFITSRPVDRIRAAFRQPKLDKLTRRRELHTVDRETIDRDVKSFFVTRLPKEAENREDFTPPHDPWPDAKEVSSLVKNSGGLFIYASTILKFIISRDHDPDERLRLIIKMVDTFLMGEAGLDDLYVQILIQALEKSVAGDSKVFSNFRLVVGCIVLAFDPLSRTSLAKILDMNANHISRALRHLHPVLIIPDSASDPITAAHKSFPDFLTDPSRCKDTRFYVDCNVQHAVLGIQCLKLMTRDLKKNICSIPERTLNKEVKDLAKLRQECIGDALEYSCRFFARHIDEAVGGEVDETVELLKMFVERLVLQWLEVLSIVGHMREAVYSLNYIKGWLVKAKINDEDLLDSIVDCHRFVLKFFDVIEESATYIYDFTLLWCPTASPLRRRYSDELASKVKVLKGLESSWDRCSRMIDTGCRVGSVLFSHDGRLVVGRGEMLGIYEVATGACLMKIDEATSCIAISFDDELVASGGWPDLEVKVWDIKTGELVHIFSGHTDDISCLAFSPCGTAIASGSSDQTLKVWDLSSGDCTVTLECRLLVESVWWCGDTNRVLYVLEDGTINVADVLMKTIQVSPFFGWGLKTSPDGLTFASGSGGTITICDTQTLIPTKTFQVANTEVLPISFSPDRLQIVYWSGGEVRVLDLEHGSTMPIFDSQSGISRGSVLSPDGSTIASSHEIYQMIKLWQCEGGISHYDHKSSVGPRSVCISADEQKIVCAFKDGTIVVRDSHTGECMETIDADCRVYSMDISRTTSLIIASSYKDCQLRLWDYCNFKFNATAQTDVKKPYVHFSVDGSEFIVSPLDWNESERDSFFIERWEIRQFPLGLRCLGREHYVPGQRLMESSQELPRRISKDKQWVVDRNKRRVCWIPPEWRRSRLDVSESKLVACIDSERMLIVDLANVRS